ncbi:hypothetical protein [Nocardia sp. NPDC051463]
MVNSAYGLVVGVAGLEVVGVVLAAVFRGGERVGVTVLDGSGPTALSH